VPGDLSGSQQAHKTQCRIAGLMILRLQCSQLSQSPAENKRVGHLGPFDTQWNQRGDVWLRNLYSNFRPAS
jgi:hypothetical protein